MTLKYFGHSAFQIITDGGISILIDPFITGNPFAKTKAEELKANFIIVTHAHGDHLGDTQVIADKKDTTIICVPELAWILQEEGYKTHELQIGGSYSFSFGDVRFVKAEHGSATPDGRYAGLAAGAIISTGGKTIYHAGDTGIYGDMKLTAELYEIDYFLVPIGGNYTMDYRDAALAASWLKAKMAIPMHFNTFPVIEVDPAKFVQAAERHGVQARVMGFEEEITL